MGRVSKGNDAIGRSGRGARRLRALLLHRRLPLVLAALAILLTLPSLWGGLVADDYHHRLRLIGEREVFGEIGSRLDLFNFAGSNPEQTRHLMDIGFWPWWTAPEIRAAFFRPLTVATHWFDYQLWPDHPALMHAQSLLWFGGLIGVVTILFRRFMGLTWAAGLAALLYAIDDARGMPVGFLANRNALIAAFFGVMAILAHDRWRRGGWSMGSVLAPAALLLSLLSAEAGIGTIAYLFAHAVFLDRGTWRRRVLILIPYAAVVIAWRITWTVLGYGVSGMGFYLDPIAEPLRFLTAVVERAPLLLLGQWLLPPSDVHFLLVDLGMTSLYYLWVVPVLLVIGIVVLRRLHWDATTRFWVLGMLLALVPICSTFPADRMLFFVGLGGFALLAHFLAGAFGQSDSVTTVGDVRSSSRFAGKLAFAFVLVHFCFAPLALAVRSAMPVGPRNLVERLGAHNVPMDDSVADQSVVIVTAPLPLAACYLPERRALDGLPVPAHTRVLAPSHPKPVVVHRPNVRTLIVRPGNGYLWMAIDQLARGPHHPMSLGERVELTDMTATVTALTEGGRPAEVSFEFRVPLEDASLRFLYWNDEEFAPFTPPPVGESVHLPAEPDPTRSG